jgi:GT2 family glycosyltransferase
MTPPILADHPDLSICIITLNARDYLRACLQSLPAGARRLCYEVIVVDNGSQDGTCAMLAAEFPTVQCIVNPTNLGYTRPMNQALRQARGRYLMQLNADTLVQPGAFDALLSFLDARPQAGIASPKVLNRDGSLQRQCRRSAARPWDVITYFSGLSRLFPRSRLFGRYLLTYRGDDETFEVEAVSGSCMAIRRAVVDAIGYLDETYFAYQEDADFCFRARQAGWQVWYYPGAVITHFGGQSGSTHQLYRGIYHWHRSYLIYYRKHIAPQTFFLVNAGMYAAMAFKFALAMASNLLRRKKVVGTPKP